MIRPNVKRSNFTTLTEPRWTEAEMRAFGIMRLPCRPSSWMEDLATGSLIGGAAFLVFLACLMALEWLGVR